MYIPYEPYKYENKYPSIWLKAHEASGLFLEDSGTEGLGLLSINGATDDIWVSPEKGITGASNATVSEGTTAQTLTNFFNLDGFDGKLIVSCWVNIPVLANQSIFSSGSSFPSANPDGCITLRLSSGSGGTAQFGLRGNDTPAIEANFLGVIAPVGLTHIMFCVDCRNWSETGGIITGFVNGAHASSTELDVAASGSGPPQPGEFVFGGRYNTAYPTLVSSEQLGAGAAVSVRSLYFAKLPKEDFNLTEIAILAKAMYQANGNIPRSLTL